MTCPDHHAKTVYTESIVIKQLFRWAKRRLLLLENPVESIAFGKPKMVPKAGPSLAEISLILQNSDGPFHAIIAMLAFTGMRSGELQRLRVEDVDFAGGWIHVVSRPGAETKNRESRKIPIHPRLREILQAVRRFAGPWYFNASPSPKYPDGGHWICAKKLNDRLKSLLEMLKLPVGREEGFVIHSLRHSFETIYINASIPQRVVDNWLGHTSDQSMGAVYYRLSDQESQRFMPMVPFGTSAPAAVAGRETVS